LTDCVLTSRPSSSPAHAVASRSVSGDPSRNPMQFVSRVARSSSRARWVLLPAGWQTTRWAVTSMTSMTNQTWPFRFWERW